MPLFRSSYSFSIGRNLQVVECRLGYLLNREYLRDQIGIAAQLPTGVWDEHVAVTYMLRAM